MDTDMYDHLLKVIVVGDSSVGKSCMLSRFVDKCYDNVYNSTIGVDFKLKHIVADGKHIKLQIWDTAGQDRFKTIISSYYRGAGVALLVFDLGNKDSFKNLDKWYQEVKDMGSCNTTILLVGCKCDTKRAVTDNEIKEWTAQHGGMTYSKCSSLTGEGVEEVFHKATHEALTNEAILRGLQTPTETRRTKAHFNILEPRNRLTNDKCPSCTIL